MKTTTGRLLAAAGATLAFAVPFAAAPAHAVQQPPPRCSIEKSGPITVTGSCPTGFYWVTAKCQNRFSGEPAWVRHTWGDSLTNKELSKSCVWYERLVGGEVFNATTGEKARINP